MSTQNCTYCDDSPRWVSLAEHQLHCQSNPVQEHDTYEVHDNHPSQGDYDELRCRDCNFQEAM